MLVLTRRKVETIRIDGGIVITVVAVLSHGVRIGIEAPEHVRVFREEICPEPTGEPER